MAEPTREELIAALRKADAANDTAAARAIARRIADMDGGLDMSDAPITDTRPYTTADAATDVPTVMAKGAAKAVTGPFDLATEVGGAVESAITGVLTPVISGGLDFFGFDNAANAVRAGGASRQQDIASNTQNLQFRNALDRFVPTPKGFELSEMGAELVAGMGIPFRTARGPIQAPRASTATEAQQVIAEGARRNVPVMTTDVRPPRSGIGRTGRALAEAIPVTGTSGPRARQQAKRIDLVQDVVEEFGGRVEVDGLSFNPVEEVSQALTRSRSERLEKLTTAKDSVIDGIERAFTRAPKATAAIDEQITRLRGIDAQEFSPVIERLERFKTRLNSGELTLRQVEENRRLLGDLFADNNLANIRGAGQKAINAIYKPLRDDMGDFIESAAGKPARGKWQKANDQLAAMVGDFEDAAFKNVLKKADVTPDSVANILFKGGDRGNASMRRLVSNLDEAGRRKVQGALMSQAWRKAMSPQGVSVEKFLNELSRLSDNLDIAFRGPEREALKGVERLLNATRRASAAAAKDMPTGVQNAPTIMGFGAASVAGPAGGAATLGVGGLLARLYESAGVRNLLVGLAKSKQGSAAEKTALNRIMRSAAPIINNWQDDLAKMASNDNAALMTSAAAQDEE